MSIHGGLRGCVSKLFGRLSQRPALATIGTYPGSEARKTTIMFVTVPQGIH